MDQDSSPPVVRQFLALHESKDVRGARELFNQSPVVLWFMIPPADLGRILDEILSSSPAAQDEAAGFQVFLASSGEGRYFAPDVTRQMSSPSKSAGLIMKFGYAMDLRLRGKSVEALALFERIRADLDSIHALADQRNSWPQFLSLQAGITALLVGDFQQALNYFAETLARRVSPGMEMIARSALVRSALIEAAFGNSQAARIHLDRAQSLPRTSSWVEPPLESHTKLVLVLLESDAQLAGRMLAQVNLADIGEMWPFYVFADYIVHDRVQAHARIGLRLGKFASLPFASKSGEGFPGSVLPLAQASHYLYSGNALKARAFLKQADQDFLLTKLVTAMVDLHSGDPGNATKLMYEVRRETVELRRAELWRVSLCAQGYLVKGDSAGAQNALRELENLFQPLRAGEVSFFTQAINELASNSFTWWPTPADQPAGYFERLPRREEQLTEREMTVLNLLSLGYDRVLIAETLHVSPNTLKTQVRSIYRKLDAASRAEALQQAAKRGLL
ncbi:MAG: response regulator transcription factor [Leucobacter sp.]